MTSPSPRLSEQLLFLKIRSLLDSSPSFSSICKLQSELVFSFNKNSCCVENLLITFQASPVIVKLWKSDYRANKVSESHFFSISSEDFKMQRYKVTQQDCININIWLVSNENLMWVKCFCGNYSVHMWQQEVLRTKNWQFRCSEFFIRVVYKTEFLFPLWAKKKLHLES